MYRPPNCEPSIENRIWETSNSRLKSQIQNFEYTDFRFSGIIPFKSQRFYITLNPWSFDICKDTHRAFLWPLVSTMWTLISLCEFRATLNAYRVAKGPYSERTAIASVARSVISVTPEVCDRQKPNLSDGKRTVIQKQKQLQL
jgi:hypothetical protein